MLKHSYRTKIRIIRQFVSYICNTYSRRTQKYLHCNFEEFKGMTTVKKLTDEVLLWLSVWSIVQMICIWSSYCHPIISCFIKIQNGFTFLVLTYSGCPGKEAVKLVLLVVCGECQAVIYFDLSS